LSEKLIRAYLPAGFAEFFMLMETVDYYDRPDYDKLIKILEKGRDLIPFYPKSKLTTSLVDQDLFENDPIHLKYQELLQDFHIKKYGKHSLLLDQQQTAPPVVPAQVKELKLNPASEVKRLPVTSQSRQSVRSKLSTDDVGQYLQRKNCQRFAEKIERDQ